MPITKSTYFAIFYLYLNYVNLLWAQNFNTTQLNAIMQKKRRKKSHQHHLILTSKFSGKTIKDNIMFIVIFRFQIFV